MNNWFRSVLAELSDGPKLISTLLGGAKELSVDLCLSYYNFVKKLGLLSIPVIIFGAGFFILSNITGIALFNFMGVLVFGLLALIWIIVSQPVIAAGEQLTKIPAFDRLFKRVLNIDFFLILVMLLVVALTSSAGVNGLQKIFTFILLTVGFALIGIRITRKAVGVQFIMYALTSYLCLYFPLTTNNFSTILTYIDRNTFNKLPLPNELEMSPANLSGGSNAPPLFAKGKPLWWCRKDAMSVAEYRCFDQSGRDPTTNEELVAISPEIIRHATNRLLDERKQVALQQAEEKRSVVLQQAKNAALTEQARVKVLNDEKNTYIGKYLATGGNRVGVAIAFLKNQSLDNAFAQQIQARISNLSSSHFLTQQAGSDGVFSRIFAGDKSEFAKLELSRVADRIMVGKITEHFENNRELPGVTDAIVNVEVKILDVKTGQIIKSGRFSSDAMAGYSQSEAQRKAQDGVITQIVNNITSSI
ncbi:MAG: hypothetical protein WAT68_08235 [Candidatus Nitrotoga sp.]